MKKLISGAIVFVASSLANVALGTPVSISLIPSTTTVTTGGTLNVSALISGLGLNAAPKVGAFDLSIGYNNAILTPTLVTFSGFLGDPAAFDAITSSDFTTTPGVAEFAEVSFLSPSDLYALQPSSFVLATVSFVGKGNGAAAFSYVGDVRVDDEFGNKLIPEPGTLASLALGLAAVLVWAHWSKDKAGER
jgi:hypothetical protein